MTATSLHRALLLRASASENGVVALECELKPEKRQAFDAAFVEMFRECRIAGRICGSEFPTLLEAFHRNPDEVLEVLSGRGSNPV